MKHDKPDTRLKQDSKAELHQEETEASQIHFETSGGGTVTLTGRAASWQAITGATHAAWMLPGVTEVIDRVTRPMCD